MIDKKVVLVVGCGKRGNTGEAIAKKFKDEGHFVIGSDIEPREQEWPFDTFLLADVTEKYEVISLIDNIYYNQGRLDILINSAGVNLLGSIDKYPEECWDKTIDVNLKGNFLLLQAYVQHFDNDGILKRFIPISSDTAMVPKTSTFANGASKAGLNHFIRCTARELNKYHNDWIITTIAPGMIEDTPMDKKTISDLTKQRGISKEEAKQLLFKNVPMGRGLSVDEVADWVYFMATKGNYASGNILRVDGGQQQG